MNESGMSPADVAAVVDNNRGGYGYGYPMMPIFPYGGFGGGFGNGFGGDGGWLWLILILAVMNGGWGNGFGGGNNISAADIAAVTNGNNNYRDLDASIDSRFISRDIFSTNQNVSTTGAGLASDICQATAGINSNIANLGYNLTSQIADNKYDTTLAILQNRFDNQLGQANSNSQMQKCCCDIREAIAGVNYNNALQTQTLSSQIASENCQDRAALQEGIRDIIQNQTFGVQRILDQLCNDKIDAKNEKIQELQRELQMADLKASQIAQTAELRLGQEREVDALYNRLATCPVGTMPVYGNQPIFTCPNNNNGCGCNGNGSYL